MLTQPLTHRKAVERCALWLRNNRQCAVVMAERRVTGCSEQPDVLGWKGNGVSYLIECKVSREDFLVDKEKSFRRCEEQGVGDLRYYAGPPGLLRLDELPPGWGLLEIHDYQIRERFPTEMKPANRTNEVIMLIAAIRRLEMSATVFVRHEEDPRCSSAESTGTS